MKCISKWISRYVVEKTHPSIRDGNYISKWICGYAVEPSFRDGNDISKWIRRYMDTHQFFREQWIHRYAEDTQWKALIRP